MLTPQDLWKSLVKATILTLRHDGVEHAGYLAFLGLLAMFPFLVLLVALIGVMGQGQAGADFITSLLSTLPGDVTNALRPRIVEIISGPPQGLLTVSILGAIWTASSAVEGLRTILNRAYHVATPPAYWFRRSLSILQLMIFTFVLITGMMLVVFAPLVFRHIESWLGVSIAPIDASNAKSLSRVVFFGIVFTVFVAVSSIYYLIPNMKQRLVSVAPGAAMVVGLWIGAADLFTLYLSHFDQMNLIYGSLGGIIAALIFFYICNLIFIFGAEFNHQIVEALGLPTRQRED